MLWACPLILAFVKLCAAMALREPRVCVCVVHRRVLFLAGKNWVSPSVAGVDACFWRSSRVGAVGESLPVAHRGPSVTFRPWTLGIHTSKDHYQTRLSIVTPSPGDPLV